MTARVIAAKCERNNWTFIYLKQTQHIAAALKIAELYSPAVLFSEDIDQAVQGDRDEALNNILNTLDGIDTKDKPIITILTTNNEEKIHAGFLRAGRIDTVVFMGPPEASTASRFVKLYAGNLAAPDVDLVKVGEAFSGFVPAFIAEAVQKAKRAVIHRERSSNIEGKVTTEDFLLAAQALIKHRDMVNNRKTKSEPEVIFESLKKLGSVVAEANSASPEQPNHQQILNKVQEVYEKVR